MGVILNPGSIVDKKYQIIRFLGRGSVGTVYEVKRLNDMKNVALKIADVFGLSQVKKRVEREIRMMQAIDHPNVIKILDSGEVDDMIYIVMPLAKGTLCTELPAYKADNSKAFTAFEEICLGVHAMHVAGVFHRDIKPSNCLRMPNGQIAVSDLGIGRFDERDTETITTTNAKLGTAAYFAPEQCAPGGAKTADGRADVFQLGKTLYQLLTDELPMYMDLNKVPVGIRHIISRATKTAKEERYQSVAQLMDAIRLYQQSLDPNINTQAAYDNVRQEIKQLLQQNQYNTALLQQAFGYLGKLFIDDLRSGLIQFDRLDDDVLVLGAQHTTDEITEVLKAYIKALNDLPSGTSFSYAEVVAKKMRGVFNNTQNAELRTLSLEATLVAAVHRHRFAAMDVFNSMLKQVKEDESLAVSEMLRRQIDNYKFVAEQLPEAELLHLIQQVRREAVPPKVEK